jgi:hypothetical protein
MADILDYHEERDVVATGDVEGEQRAVLMLCRGRILWYTFWAMMVLPSERATRCVDGVDAFPMVDT